VLLSSGNVFGRSHEIATIRELAELSGVSVATVSRVLNDYDDVSAATRERVLKLAHELEYTPTAAARTLVTKRSYVVGVVLSTGVDHPDIQHPFFQEVLVGLKRRLGAGGYDLLLLANEESGNAFGAYSYLQRCRHHRVDGVVLMGAQATEPDVRKLARSTIPCVAVDLDLVGRRTGFVISDNTRGAQLALEHLHALGHERIATITGPTETRVGMDRFVGYREALERLGLPYREEYVADGDFYFESGAVAMQELLSLPQPPTAVFAASDLMAAGAIRAIEEADLSVPADIAVVGFDDIQLAAMMQPALTTIRQDKLGLGAAAAEALLRMIELDGAPPPGITLPVELVVRASSGGKRRADDQAAK
jgi:LacI family transcriptional regulator, galactose operon repressor